MEYRKFGNTGLKVSALGFGAYTLSEYITLLMPATAQYIGLMAVCLLLLLTGFHWLGTRSAGRSQEVLAVLKAVGLLLFVVVCFLFGGNPTGSDLTDTIQKQSTTLTFIAVISALQAIFYTYDGWHTATYFSEENTNPAKTLPKSMLYGVVMVIIIYMLVNGAILYALPHDTLSQSKLAAADTISYIFGDQYARVITILLMVSILGIVNAQIMFAPRVIYSMSRDGLFLKAGTQVNKAGTPSVAMPLTSLFSIMLILSGKDTCSRLSDIATFFFVLSYAAGFGALIRLRYSEPELPRPFKAPLFPLLPSLLIVLSLMFLAGAVYSDIKSSLYALVFLVLSYPLFILVVRLNKD